MARVKTGAIRVDGLVELSRALKSMGSKELLKELKKANKDAATLVKDKAQSRARSLGGVAAKSAPSLKEAVGATSAGVALGSDAYPFAVGAEFGSKKYTQFKPWRGNGQDAGYFLYPTIRDEADGILEPYTEAIDRLLRKAGLK